MGLLWKKKKKNLAQKHLKNREINNIEMGNLRWINNPNKDLELRLLTQQVLRGDMPLYWQTAALIKEAAGENISVFNEKSLPPDWEMHNK